MQKAIPIAKRNIDILYFVHIVVFFGITFCFGRIEPIEPLTLFGMNTIGVFLGVIYAWIFIDIIWPSMIGLLALMLLDVIPTQVLLNKGFGSPTVIMMMFIFVFSATLDKHGLSKFISLWFISRKCVAHSPWVLTFVILLAIAILGGLTSATPAAIIGWSLLYGIFNICGYSKKEGYPVMMMIGAVYAAQLGMSLIPFKSLPLVSISAYETLSGVSIDYAIYMLISFVSCLLCLLFFIFLGKYMFRPDLSKLENIDINSLIKKEDMHLNGIQRILLFFLAALILFMMAPSFLPQHLVISIFFEKIGNTGICILLVAVLCAIRIEGKTVLPFKAMVHDGVAWPLIFILAFTLPLAGPLADPKSGITAFMLDILSPLFGASSGMLFVASMGVVAVIMTQFINNTALAIALMPVAYSYCSTNSINPVFPVILITISCCLAFLTPAASSTAAMLHGNDWVDTKHIWKIAPLLIVFSIAISTIVVVVIGNIFS